MTERIVSADGTSVAIDVGGSGPPVVLLAGAFCTRGVTAPLAAALQDRFTTYNVDRRGRGDSGDTEPYAVQREIEDIAAVVDAAGGVATVFGHSSGATLVLRAAIAGVAVSSLVLYEPPFLVDGSRAPLAADFADRLAGLIAEGRRGEAVELYQTEGIGMPAEVVSQLRTAPFRPGLEAIAHTLVYDALAVGDLRIPAGIDAVNAPTLVLDGELSPPMLRSAAAALAGAMPVARQVTLMGQRHDIDPGVTAAAIADFLRSPVAQPSR